MADSGIDYTKFTVGQLKEELKKKGLDTSGKKADLVARLTGSEDDEKAEPSTEDVITKIEQVTAEEDDEEEDDEQMDTLAEEENGEPENAEGGEAGEEEEQPEEKKDDEDEVEDDEVKKDEEEDMEEDNKEEEKEDKYETIPGYEDLESDPNFMLVKWIDNKIIWVPVKDQIKNEVVADTRWRTVVVYPVLIDDLQNPALLDLLHQCLHFHINFKASWSITNKTDEGYVELLFRTFEEAKTVADAACTIREGIEIKHLGCNDSRVQLISDWRKEKKASENTILSRLLFLGNLPKDVEELQLIEMFPDGMRAIVARKEDRELRGYGYIEYETEEALEEAVDKYKDLEIGGNKLCVMRCMKEKPIGILSDKQRENIVRKIRGVRNALKYKVNQMSYEEQQYQKTFQNRLLEKLRADTNVRREHGLLPPDRMKMLEEREKKQKAEAEEKAKQEEEERKKGGGPSNMRKGGFRDRRSSGGYQHRSGGGGYRGGRGGYQRGGGGGGGQGNWGGPQRSGGNWNGGGGGGGGRGGRGRGEMAMAMNLLHNLSHALGSGGGGRGGGGRQGGGGYGNQGGGYGGDGWGGGYGGQQGGWGGKRRASNEGMSDWKRRPGGGDGGRRGGYGGGGRQNWY